MGYSRFLSLIVATVVMLTAGGVAGAGDLAHVGSMITTPWPATDGLGRALPMAGDRGIPAPRADRFVGIFYFLWHNDRATSRPGGDGPFDVAKILAQDPQALEHPGSKLWGGFGQFHYWSEPLFGYYLSNDPWVIRKHAQLLAAAGVDTLIFDATNVETYPANYTAICEVFQAIRKAGGKTPAIAFMVNTEAKLTTDRLYADLYKPGRFRELWFRWQGKPLLLCDPTVASPAVCEVFTLRRAHWPFEMINTPNAWHWEATYPQPYGYTDDPKKPEQVNVSVAQNLRASDGLVTNMSEGNARGRSFHDGKRDRSAGAVERGGNFAEQWRRALELDPPFVMVTGWNEWIAGKYSQPNQPIVFVDQFDQEFSRDIEPMKGGHLDNYYYQMVAGIRRYKGVPKVAPGSGAKSIRIDGDFTQWDGVLPEFHDDLFDTEHRDFDGAGGMHYVNTTGRNDLAIFKVAEDARNVSFYARTREPLTPATGPGWMWLLLDVDRDPKTGWLGFDFIVNRTVDSRGETWVEKNEGGWNWKKVAKVAYRNSGNELQVGIPKHLLWNGGGKATGGFDFQWADHLGTTGEPEVGNFYRNGDVAPEGRFRFRFPGDR